MDIFTDRGYLHGSGVFSCECVSVVGGERLTLRFRKPLRHDAVDGEVPGVTRKKRAGYDIEDLWIMGIYNRLRDRCASCEVMLLTYEWSVNKESLWLFMCEGFEGVDGVLMAAVGPSDSFSRFGFYSLDFSNK